MRVSVLPLVRFGQVLRPPVEVVVRVVGILGDQAENPLAKVPKGAVLPLVDQKRARRVRTERDDGAFGHTRVLDRPCEILGEVQVRVPARRGDLDGGGGGLHRLLLVSGAFASAATGNWNVNVLPFPGSLSAQIRPPCASTTERAMARPIPVPPSSRERALSTR